MVAPVTILNVPPVPHDCLGGPQIDLPGFTDVVLLDKLPEPVLKVAPAYPDIAREAGVDGLVNVAALVCASGIVYDTRMTKSIPMLDAAAVEAVRQWVFTPATQGYRPVAAWVECPIRFTLRLTKDPDPESR